MEVDEIETLHKPRLGVMTATVRAKFTALMPFRELEIPYIATNSASYHDLLETLATLRKRRETRPGGSADPYAQGWPTVEARARAHWAQLEPDSRARVVTQLGWDPTQQRQHDPLDWYDLADLACGALISQRMRAAEQQDLAQARADGTLDWVRTIVAGITARKAKS